MLIQPQSMRMDLRLQEKQSLGFRLGQSKQYPLDLYFLLDFSNSMRQTLDNVANQGQAIINVLQDITKGAFLCSF